LRYPINKGKLKYMGMVVKRLIIILTIFLGSFVSCFSYTGETGPPMLKMIYGSRALSLGGAFVGLCDDVYYMDSNPAGGDIKSIYKVSVLHQEWIEDVNYEAIRISRGFNDIFFIGAGITYLYLPFTYYDYYGQKSDNSYIISQGLGILNAGFKLQKYDIYIGSNLKFFYNNVPESLYKDQSYFILASDIGVIKKTNLLKRFIGPEPSLVFGLALRNIGYSRLIEKLPAEVHAGISYRPIRNLLISTEMGVPLYEPVYGSIGAEYDFHKTFFIDGGIQIKENPMFSIGLGYKRNDLQINVSYTPTIAFYNMMSVSLSYSFGEQEKEKKEIEVEILLIKAFKLFSERQYQEALDVIAKVLEIDPKNPRALSLKKTMEIQLELKERLEKIENE